VLQQLKAVAGFDPRQLYSADGLLKEVQHLDDETAAALASIELEEVTEGTGDAVTHRRTKKVRHWSKTEALRLLSQIMGMLAKEQIELSGPGGTPFAIELVRFTDGSQNPNTK
jgi:phage terminase small subunit